MDSMDALINIVKTEIAKEEDEAFTLFCKDEIKVQLTQIDEAKKLLDKLNAELEEVTEDTLKIKFENKTHMQNKLSYKEHYINKIKNKT